MGISSILWSSFLAHVALLLRLFWCNIPLLHESCPPLPASKGQYSTIGLGSGELTHLQGRGSAFFRQSRGHNFVVWFSKTENDGVILLGGPFHKNRLALTNPRALADVLVHNTYDFEKPRQVRNFLRKVLGDGLIITEGDDHKFQRKHVMPAFSFRHIKELYPMMWRKSIALIDRLNAEVQEKDAIEMYGWSSKATLDIIGIAGLGREFNMLKNSDDELVQCYEELLEPTVEKLVFFLLSSFGPKGLVQKLPWRMNKIFKDTTDSLRIICGRLVREKRELIKASADDNFDILSLLIKSEDFADDALVDQLLTFLAAG